MHSRLRLDTFDVAVFQPPKHVLRAVAADAQVHRFTVVVMLLPHFSAGTFPAFGNRVANTHQIYFSLLGALVQLHMSLHPIRVTRNWSDGRMRGRVVRLSNRD